MDFEKYTERSRGFIQSAQTLALREGHQKFTPEHVLKVLLDDEEGLAAGLIKAAGGDSRLVPSPETHAPHPSPPHRAALRSRPRHRSDGLQVRAQARSAICRARAVGRSPVDSVASSRIRLDASSRACHFHCGARRRARPLPVPGGTEVL